MDRLFPVVLSEDEGYAIVDALTLAQRFYRLPQRLPVERNYEQRSELALIEEITTRLLEILGQYDVTDEAA